MTDLIDSANQIESTSTQDNLAIQFFTIDELHKMVEQGEIVFFNGDNRFVRSEINQEHVVFLMDNRLKNPVTGKYSIEPTDPLVIHVLPNGVMQVVDGNHRLKALLEVFKTKPNAFGKIAYQIYERQLSDDELLSLQIRSNDSTKSHTPSEIGRAVVKYRSELLTKYTEEQLGQRKIQKSITDKITSVFGITPSHISNYIALYENEEQPGYSELTKLIDDKVLEYSVALALSQRSRANNWELEKLLSDYKGANTFNGKFVPLSKANTIKWLDSYAENFLKPVGKGEDGDGVGENEGNVKPSKSKEPEYTDKDMLDVLALLKTDEFKAKVMNAKKVNEGNNLVANINMLLNHLGNSIGGDKMLTAMINFMDELITVAYEKDTQINSSLINATTIQALKVQELVDTIEKKVERKQRKEIREAKLKERENKRVLENAPLPASTVEEVDIDSITF